MNFGQIFHIAEGPPRERLLTLRCTHCRAECSASMDEEETALVRCKECQEQFVLEEGLSLLDLLILYLQRMVFGAFYFLFCRIPAWVHEQVVSWLHWLVDLVPLAWKCLRAGCWAGVWAMVLFGPSVAFGIAGVAAWKTLPAHLKPWSLGLWGSAAGWLLFMGVGYVWAFCHYRRKRKHPPLALPVPAPINAPLRPKQLTNKSERQGAA